MHATCLTLALAVCFADTDLLCISADGEAGSPREIVYRHFLAEAIAALDKRDERYESLKTAEQIAAYQQRLREFFVERLGGFPDRTPLNARTVGEFAGDGYRVQKVIFESQPNHHVTALLYLPAGVERSPGVVVASGHSRTGKAADYNQRYGIALAKHGIAALCYDPIGQGERSQILDDGGQPRFNSTTREHFLIGVGSILVGTNTARYRVWDGMRAIDYLCSRDDIDPDRIGFTGCSGGGTLTSYVMALDDRVRCAAPACYLTTFRRLLETIGPQDAEQNIFGQVAFGMDQTDYVLMRAPKPTLISSTTDDFFDIQGSWDNFRQSKRIYTRLDASEKVDLVEAAGGHGVQPENLLAIVQWMRHWLLDAEGPAELGDLSVRPTEELNCTEQGQVLRLAGERSVFDLNQAWADSLASARHEFWEQASEEEARQRVRDTVHVRTLEALPKPRMEKRGRVNRDYHIDKLTLWTAQGLPLPVLTYHPPEPREDAYLYLHEAGKAADDGADGPIEQLVAEGYVVVAVDLTGIGETGQERRDELLGNWKNYFIAYLLGKSMVGVRTEDVLLAGRWVAEYETDDRREVHLLAAGSTGVPALHAAALEPGLFTSVRVRDTLTSWSSIVGRSVPEGQLTSTIHGVLTKYDLPDLRKLIERQSGQAVLGE